MTVSQQTDIEQRIAWLEEHTRKRKSEQAEAAAREGQGSGMRLMAFVAILVPWFFLSDQTLVAFGISVVATVVFVITIRRHLALKMKRERLDRDVQACEEAGARIGGQVHLVRETEPTPVDPELDALLPSLLPGAHHWELTSQETGDLDLFSPPVGCFGLLNRTSTQLGANRLKDAVTRPLLDAEAIERRYEGIAWLSENGSARLSLLAGCASLRHEDKRLDRLIRAISGTQPLQTSVPVNVARLWSILSGGFCLLALVLAFSGNLAWASAIGLFLTANGLLYMQLSGPLFEALEPWRDVSWAARGLEEAVETAARELPDHTELAELGNACRAAVKDQPLTELRGRIGWSESGGLVSFLLNMLFLVDLHVAAKILSVALPNREKFLAAASSIVDLEVRLSLASLHAEQPLRCKAEPSETTELHIDTGVHPLVDPDVVIPNDVTLDAQLRFWMITGSNMAGKSTLLRMVALNIVLAQVGGFALARQMRWRPVRLMTDLRANDNLSRNESYFLAEVRHLRRMVVPPEDNTPLLGLIDEPFRGTNSEDQTAASVAVVRHLQNSGNMFLLATHDRFLTQLADGREIKNFHFRENLGKDGMVFDYRLHDGPATTRNALRILEREGYPPELMEVAHAWHAQQEDEAGIKD